MRQTEEAATPETVVTIPNLTTASSVPIITQTQQKSALARLADLLKIGAPVSLRAGVAGVHFAMIRAVLSGRGLFSGSIFAMIDFAISFLFSMSRLASPLAASMKELHPASVGTIFQRTLFFASTGAVLFGLLLTALGPFFLKLTGESDAIISGARLFLPLYAAAMLIDGMHRITSRTLIGLKFAWLPLATESAFLLADTALSGKMTDAFGMPGAAASYLLMSIVLITSYWTYLSCTEWMQPFAFFSTATLPHHSVDNTSNLAKKGLFIAVSNVFISMTQLALMYCVGAETANALGPAQVYSMLFGYAIQGLGIAVSSKIGSLTDTHEAIKIVKTAQIFSIGIAATASLIVVLTADLLVKLFAGEHGKKNINMGDAAFYLRFQTIIELLNGLRAISNAAHEAKKNTETPFRYNVGFIGLLNTTLIFVTRLLACDPKIIYGTQLAGVAGSALGLTWNAPRLFQQRVETVHSASQPVAADTAQPISREAVGSVRSAITLPITATK